MTNHTHPAQRIQTRYISADKAPAVGAALRDAGYSIKNAECIEYACNVIERAGAISADEKTDAAVIIGEAMGIDMDY